LISTESQKDQSRQSVARRFALGTSLFYASTLGLLGTYLPFFSVWLKNIGIDAQWIGIITAMPSLSRFTILPFVTAFAEHRNILRSSMIVMAFLTALGFAVVGLLVHPVPILIAFALLACVWTPLSPLTDGYALKGVATYGLNYGPMRLWGSAAFIVGALGCGLLLDVLHSDHLIWIIVAAAGLSAFVGLGLVPLDAPPATAEQPRASGLLKQPLFWAIIGAHTLIQGSHGAYYAFASITWQSAGFGGFAIALLWSVGVIAEIVIFAISPRFTLSPTILVIIGAVSAVLRWILTAMEPRIEILTLVQLMHGLTFGITQVGIVALLVRSVPHHLLASAQGYLVAFGGIVSAITVIVSGLIYARWGSGVYFVMAVMAAAGGMVMLVWRARLDAAHTAPTEPSS
jgi:MFS transporter, PPP family, 3-phenylpropionic acid transporter